MMTRYILFAGIAIFQTIVQTQHMPTNAWEWTKFYAGLALGAFLAIKATQSKPDELDKPAEVKIVNAPENPAPTIEKP